MEKKTTNDTGAILVVDDDESSLAMLEHILSQQGYHVHCADSGKQALGAVETLSPELILLDINLPDMDGFSVLRQLQARPECRDIAVIFLSGFTETGKRIDGFKLGAVDYIVKPFEPEELLARVHTHLELRRLRNRFKHQAADLRLANELLLKEIYDRKKAEDGLRQSSIFIEALLNAIPLPVFYKDLDARYLGCNRAFEEFYGCARQDLIGKSVFDIADDELARVYHAKDLELLQHSGLQVYESQVRDVRGAVHDVVFHKAAFPGPGGRTAGLIGAVVDITQRKRAEEALKLELAERKRVEAALLETESLLAEARQIAHLGTWTYNPETGHYRWSDEIYRILGLPVGSPMLFSEFTRCVHPEDYPALVKAWNGFNDERSLVELEYRIIRPGGEIRHIHDCSIFNYGENGKLLNSAALLLDITERKLAEQALQEKNAELERFTYTVSHDLRSPLVTIRTFMGHLADDLSRGDTENIARDLQYIHTATAKMGQLLDELLHLSRLGRVMNPSVETPLQEIVREALALVAGRIDQRGVRVQVTQEAVLLYGDRVRLAEVFQNLIDNAAKFMGEQTEPLIEIGAEIRNGEIACFVRDNGIGIDPQHTHKLFELFEKLHPEIEGSGMGLALVKRIVELHGGRIWVESEGLGKGACFWFSLPGKLVQG